MVTPQQRLWGIENLINYLKKHRKTLKSQGLNLNYAENNGVTKSDVLFTVIPSSEAFQESS